MDRPIRVICSKDIRKQFGLIKKDFSKHLLGIANKDENKKVWFDRGDTYRYEDENYVINWKLSFNKIIDVDDGLKIAQYIVTCVDFEKK